MTRPIIRTSKLKRKATLTTKSTIEQYHRAIKQICHIEHFQVRRERPIKNHIFASLLSFVYLQKMQLEQELINLYQHQRELFKETVGAFIENFTKGKDQLLPKFVRVINA